MILRNSSELIKELASEFKVVAVVGPRQSGKTTLVKKVFNTHAYVSLENPDALAFAREDPRGFLAHYEKGVIIDEAQRYPDLFSYLQEMVDRSRQPGRFILTGSQHFSLIEKITQSLAGRVGFLRLLPFSYSELMKGNVAPKTLNEMLYQGGYPPLYDQPVRPLRWLNAYISTYIERDVRQVLNIRNLGIFQQFMKLCAGSTGQLLNLSRMGSDIGVDQKTIRNWLSVLEASFIVYRLQPHDRNFRKRLVKAPKLYFYDTGLACRLLGIEASEQLVGHPMRGALFESWVLGELMKMQSAKGKGDNFFFWRNHIGQEVDVLIDREEKLLPLEIKSGATLSSDWFKALNAWVKLAEDVAGKAYLVYGGAEKQKRQGIHVIPWQSIHSLEEEV